MMHKLISTAFLLLGALLLSQQAAAADEADVPTYGDWGYKCDKSPDGNEELCFVFQNVTKKDSGQLVLAARVAYREGQADPLIVVTVPLGSLLPPGAALVVEGVEPLKMVFFLCANEGCTTVATPLSPELLKAMKQGEQAVVRIAAPNQQVVGLPLSLKGFTKAESVLKQKK